MAVLSEFLKDFLMRFRTTRVRNSIAIPIVMILLSIAVVILVTGYYVNKSVFYSVFEEREGNKARNIHLTIESIVSTEVKRISSMAKILKNDTDIVYGLFHYTGTLGDTKPLKSAMDQLYPKLNLPVFVMADPGGKMLHVAGKGKRAAGGESSGDARVSAGIERRTGHHRQPGAGRMGNMGHRSRLRLRQGESLRNDPPRQPDRRRIRGKDRPGNRKPGVPSRPPRA